MKFGCIGEHLKHSFSKEIHNALCDYEYEIKEIERERLGDFFQSGDFTAINVTIPYKELVIPYLHSIDRHAEIIGAVNTVVNRDGKLFGYNTDFYGMTMLIRHPGISVKGKKVAILGTGGTAKTSYAVCATEGAREILKVSRTKKDGAISYEELYEYHSDANIIINTTPVGMFPRVFESPVDIKRFNCLEGVIDAVYNPLRTPLVTQAKEMGIVAEGGLYMLVAQAVRASEIFTGKSYTQNTLDSVYDKILSSKENAVLIGMPSSGKTTVGKMLAKRLGRPFYDTDEIIVKNTGLSIPEIFKSQGEEVFRNHEAEAVKGLTEVTCSVIATGGGAILNKENVSLLKQNGRLFFIDRPLSDLLPTEDRPLSSDAESIKKRYEERYGLYKKNADVIIDADCTAEEVCEKIRKEMKV